MTSRTSPSFDRPPISHVSLEVHYERLASVRSAHFGLFWEAIGGAETYPDTDDLYRDDVEIEKPEAERGSRLNFEFTARPPGMRARFSNETSRVEIQDNALSAAWYGAPCSGSYPRYVTVRKHFISMLESWRRVLATADLGELHLVQAEVHYRNHLLLGTGCSELDQVRRDVLKLDWLPTPSGMATESLRAYQQHVVHEGGRFAGRLYMSVNSEGEYEGTKSVDFALTARRPLAEDTPGALLASLDAGHDLIVHTFANATSEHMHALWGRRS